jgi:transmembrane sensor
MSGDMHNLLGKYFSGQATEDEVTTVKQWAHANEQNKAEFKMLEKLWNGTEEHKTLVFDTEKAWQKVNATINTPAKNGKLVSMPKWKAAVAIAASLVLVLAVWWITGNKGNDMHTILAETAIREVKLPDGSRVYLRKGSTLEYPEEFAKSNRDVTLKGEAFFDVEHDPSLPFIIMAGESYIRVVGTSFSVDATAREVELIVKTGKVNFGSTTDTSNRVLVTAGEKAVFVDNMIRKMPDTDINSVAWMSKELAFEQTPLPEVVAALNDYYKVMITLKKDDSVQMSASKITDQFKDQPLSSVLNDLSLTTTYQIRETSKDNYVISIK